MDRELERFFAVRGDTYLRHFQQASDGQPPGETIVKPRVFVSWHWPAFLLTVPWMFYRKMYSGGIILIALPVVFEHILPGALFLGSGVVIAVAAGGLAKSWYLDFALKRIDKAYRDYRSEADRRAYLGRAGGVSVAGAVFGLLTQAVTLTAVVAGLLPRGLL